MSDCFTNYIMAIQPRNEKVEIFVDYILETYISNESNFPPFLWTECSASIMRTTNSCEAFHSKFNALFYSTYPNIFVFIDVLKNVQKDTYIKLRSTHLNTRRTNIIKKETFIRNTMKRLEENQIDKFEFIQILSYKYLPVP
jgi:AAA15 family ATPase/GTPase